jgi:uncharacterized membrane protein YagU involved in acid resistance
MARAGAVGAVLRIGLIAGTLDISENLIFNAFRHIAPKVIFEYIASGLTGAWAFRAGAAAVMLGMAIHYAIALFWTAVYFFTSRRWAILVQRPVLCGLVYGVWVYLVMNVMVLPLTRLPRAAAALTLASRVNHIMAVLFCIGVTIAVLVKRERTNAGPSARSAQSG